MWDIESEPALAGTKLIAEAWDAAGLYQVGSFIGDSWKEWNGRFRDDVRSFFRGEEGFVGRIADRCLGSPEIYGHEEREVEQSVNFVACHDGFTLNDLVSYDRKHNEANGEGNRDGADDNRSWNCCAEGSSDDPAVEKLRNRQAKNFLTVTMLSLGMPMISMGDEVRRTQFGNNNAYCQDNETSWFDWTLLSKHADVHRFLTLLAARRQLRNVEVERSRVSLNQLLREATKAWHGVKPEQPDWRDCSHSLAFSAVLRREGILFYLILNAYWHALDFELPPVDQGGRLRGDDGSIRRSTPRATSSHGRRRSLFRVEPIGPSRAPSWWYSAAWEAERDDSQRRYPRDSWRGPAASPRRRPRSYDRHRPKQPAGS